MIKIIKITNFHLLDGVELIKQDFINLIHILNFSSHVHTISYYDEKGDLQVISSKGD